MLSSARNQVTSPSIFFLSSWLAGYSKITKRFVALRSVSPQIDLPNRNVAEFVVP
jgi:hypothetical protein